MHDVIQNELESYLSGRVSRSFQAHLDGCGECRREVGEMNEISGLLGGLRAESAPQPAPGFYYRLTQRLEADRKPSFWNVLAFDPAFARRVAFSSLMLLALLGSYLVVHENQISPAPPPERIIATHDPSIPHDDGSDRDRMLVTLATYNH